MTLRDEHVDRLIDTYRAVKDDSGLFLDFIRNLTTEEAEVIRDYLVSKQEMRADA
jgi:hypothetical protein